MEHRRGQSASCCVYRHDEGLLEKKFGDARAAARSFHESAVTIAGALATRSAAFLGLGFAVGVFAGAPWLTTAGLAGGTGDV